MTAGSLNRAIICNQSWCQKRPEKPLRRIRHWQSRLSGVTMGCSPEEEKVLYPSWRVLQSKRQAHLSMTNGDITIEKGATVEKWPLMRADSSDAQTLTSGGHGLPACWRYNLNLKGWNHYLHAGENLLSKPWQRLRHWGSPTFWALPSSLVLPYARYRQCCSPEPISWTRYWEFYLICAIYKPVQLHL